MTTTRTIQSVLFASLIAACGGTKVNPSLCDTAGVAANPVCNQSCDPSPAAAVTCPQGFHCNPDGKCDSQCDATHACTTGYTCDYTTGTCNYDGPGSGSGTNNGPDANCPGVHFTATPTTPSIVLVIDKSGSMNDSSGPTTKYLAVQAALTGTNGVVTQLQNAAYFGAKFFPDSNTCTMTHDVARALNNQAAIDAEFNALSPGGNTPTAATITQVAADWQASPPPTGSPPVVVLATDGQPNKCGSNQDDTNNVVTAIKNLYNTTVGANMHIPTYVLGVGDAGGISNSSLQAFANAGAGVTAGMPDAPFYRGDSPQALADAFHTIINGVVSCDLALSGQVDPAMAMMDGVVTLNGMTLTPGSDWSIDPNGTTLHILGNACNTLKTSNNPDVEAVFSCGSVIIIN